MRTSKLLTLPTVALGIASTGLATQDVVDVIYSEIQTDSSSTVPGIPGLFIDAIDRASASPDGSHWIISLTVNSPLSTDDEVAIVDGVVVLREGDTPSILPAGRAISFIDQKMDILNSGAFAFATDMDGDTLDDDIIIMGDAMGNLSLVAQENTQIVGGPAGWTEDSVQTAVITDAGVGYEADFIDNGPATGMDNLLMLNGAPLLQTNVDSPAGQFSGFTEFWDNFDTNDFFVTSDSAHYLVQGDVTGPTTEDDVLVKDGVVLLQENYPIPGGPADLIDSSGISGCYMADNGDWMARGDFDVTNDGWVVYNGVIVAQETMPVIPGSLEVFDSTFQGQACNTLGDYVVSGFSDAPTTMDGMIVLNSERIVAREGDPVDLDGNGMFDDDTFYGNFGFDDIELTDDGKLLFTCTLKNSTNVTLGDAFIIIQLGDVGTIGTSFCQPTTNSTGATGWLRATGSTAIVDNNLTLDVQNLPANQFGMIVVAPTAGTAMMPTNSQGNLCLTGQIGRYSQPGELFQSDSAGATTYTIDVTAIRRPTAPVNVPAMPGESWFFQAWHRDAIAGLPPTSNFTNGIEIMFN